MKKQYNTRAILASLLICGFVGMFSETALNIAMTMVNYRFPADSWYLNANKRAAAPEVFNETAVHRFAHQLNHGYIYCSALVQF